VRLPDKLQRLLWTLGSFTLLVAGWDLAVRLLALPVYLVPSPAAVLAAGLAHWQALVLQSGWTVGAILAGYITAVVVAIPLGMLIVASPLLERLLYPPMVASQSIPKIALAPLFIVWFGFGVWPKVAVAFMIAVFPVVVDTIVGLRSIDPGMIQLARSMGAPRYRVFIKLRLPFALPSIFGGLKVASTLAVVGALTGEFIGSDNGLGYLLVQASGQLDTPLLFATLVLLSAIAMAFFYAIELIERRCIPWHVSQRAPSS
jgi:NitT/TauT family transport system permease protein